MDLPKISTPSDLVAAASALTAATAEGRITPSEASDLVRLVEGTARAIEVHELAERIDRLEAQMASKGNPLGVRAKTTRTHSAAFYGPPERISPCLPASILRN
jgi:hypothetical protein